MTTPDDGPSLVADAVRQRRLPRSAQALETVRRLCDEELPGQVELEVVDVTDDPALAARDRIVAPPWSSGCPRRRVSSWGTWPTSTGCAPGSTWVPRHSRRPGVP